MRRDLERALALRRGGDLAGAESRLRRALEKDPRDPEALNLLGLVAIDRCDYTAAFDWLSRALKARKPHIDALVNLSVAFNRTGQYALAQRSCVTVLSHAPGHPLATINLGLAFKGMGQLDKAKTAFIAAGSHPMARFNLGYVHLLEDNLARGLPLYEERKALLGLGRGLDAPEWDGAPLEGGTLLVVHEQGLGDTILMSRFYPRLAELAGRVVVHVQPPIARLIAASFPGLHVVTSLDGVRYDAWCGHMSLPLRLGIRDLKDVPLEPWLAAGGQRSPRARPRVGINWAGNPSFTYDFIRSTHLEQLSLMLEVSEVEWCSLHRGHLEHEALSFGLAQPLAGAQDFLDTARVIADLDLVISTETAVPNLSAAMGVRTCVLTSPDVDWRWRSWYANVTVCAQDEPGNWFSAMAQALEVIRTELLAAA